MRIGVVVATYGSHDVVPGCIDSLHEHEPDACVVVVDDRSPNGPPRLEDVEVVVTPERRGYGAACNVGTEVLRRAEVDVVAFLNPDVRLNGPSLSQIAAEFDAREDLGIASGPVRAPDGSALPSAYGPTSVRRALAFAAGYEPRRLRSAAGGLLGPRRLQHDEPIGEGGLRIDGHVRGGACVARMACLDELGGFDEEFFLYWEDADLCHRAREAGWEVRLVACEPFVQVEEDVQGMPDDQRWQWFTDGASRFGRKHLVPGQARQLEAALALGRRLAQLRQRG